MLKLKLEVFYCKFLLFKCWMCLYGCNLGRQGLLGRGFRGAISGIRFKYATSEGAFRQPREDREWLDILVWVGERVGAGDKNFCISISVVFKVSGSFLSPSANVQDAVRISVMWLWSFPWPLLLPSALFTELKPHGPLYYCSRQQGLLLPQPLPLLLLFPLPLMIFLRVSSLTFSRTQKSPPQWCLV